MQADPAFLGDRHFFRDLLAVAIVRSRHESGKESKAWRQRSLEWELTVQKSEEEKRELQAKIKTLQESEKALKAQLGTLKATEELVKELQHSNKLLHQRLNDTSLCLAIEAARDPLISPASASQCMQDSCDVGKLSGQQTACLLDTQAAVAHNSLELNVHNISALYYRFVSSSCKKHFM